MLPSLEAPIIVIVLALTGLILATIQDLMTREVPDSLSSGMIVLGVSLALVNVSLGADWVVVINSLLGFGFGYGIGALLYYARQWGGGDAKLLAGLGSILGLANPAGITIGTSPLGWALAGIVLVITGLIMYLGRHEGRASMLGVGAGGVVVSIAASRIAAVSIPELFLPWYLLLIFISGAIWALGVLLYLAYKHREIFTLKPLDRIAIYTGLAFGIAMLIAIFTLDPPVPALLIVLTALVSVSPLALLVSKKLEGTLFRRSVTPEELVLGDWLAEDIVVDATIVIPTTNPGLSERQIEEITDLWEHKKISTITIKDGIAFVPAFLIAFVIVLLA